ARLKAILFESLSFFCRFSGFLQKTQVKLFVFYIVLMAVEWTSNHITNTNAPTLAVLKKETNEKNNFIYAHFT
ncbi:MAG TPA: hypothetical protein PKD42_17625, partial [Chitinophagaceae bacterium]|nr:hypothetical protein [Chitinophagaceae bacterium]